MDKERSEFSKWHSREDVVKGAEVDIIECDGYDALFKLVGTPGRIDKIIPETMSVLVRRYMHDDYVYLPWQMVEISKPVEFDNTTTVTVDGKNYTVEFTGNDFGEPKKADYEKVWDEFWADLLVEGGEINIDQVKRELSDYQFLMEEVPKVYMHVTGDKISKPNTYAADVIAASDDNVSDICNEAVADFIEEVEKKNGVKIVDGNIVDKRTDCCGIPENNGKQPQKGLVDDQGRHRYYSFVDEHFSLLKFIRDFIEDGLSWAAVECVECVDGKDFYGFFVRDRKTAEKISCMYFREIHVDLDMECSGSIYHVLLKNKKEFNVLKKKARDLERKPQKARFSVHCGYCK